MNILAFRALKFTNIEDNKTVSSKKKTTTTTKILIFLDISLMFAKV